MRTDTGKLIRCVIGVLTFASANAASGQNVPPETLLEYKPTHRNDVQIEIPTGEDIKKCTVKVEQEGNRSGYVLLGPQGQMLRRFMDTTGDGKVDEFKYFQYGIEVYRDLDTNGDNKIDQSRWLNTQGTRWGIDRDQDGTIDSWKIISAEEASREAILAIVENHPQRLQAVFINADDIRTLGLARPIAAKFLENGKDLGRQLQSLLSSSDVITPRSTWLRFDSSMLMPNLIPADEGKARDDLIVYENVMAIVSTGQENGFVQIGEMVRVGDAWKLTQMPKPIDDNQFVGEGGLLLQPSVAAMSTGTAGGLSPELQKLFDELKKLDENGTTTSSSREEIVRANVARARILAQIAELSESESDRNLWIRQRMELIASATQMDTFPNGLQELQTVVTALRKEKADPELLAFCVFQEMLVRYNLNLQTAKPEDRADVQASWLESLQQFVNEFPKAPESADALLQLAITNEFNGDEKQARIWYTRLVNDYSETEAAQRGQGALRRLGLVGQPMALQGTPIFLNGKTVSQGRPLSMANYRGKVVAVIFWATWCKPCTEDLPQIQELYRSYQRDGFEVLGVNLDSPGADIAGYLKDYNVVWPHLHEEGGLESRPAVEFGIISLPTMFLVDKTGKVVDNSVSVEDLKKQVPALLK